MFGRKKRELEEEVAALRELRKSDAQEMSQLRSAYGRVSDSLAAGMNLSLYSDPQDLVALARRAGDVTREAKTLRRQRVEQSRSVADLQAAHRQVVDALEERNRALREQLSLFVQAALHDTVDTAATKTEMPFSVRRAVEQVIANRGGAEAKADLAAATERHGIVKKRLEEQVEYLADVKNQRDHALALLATQVDGVTETTARHLAKGEEIAEKRELVVAVDRLTGAVRFGFEHPDTVS